MTKEERFARLMPGPVAMVFFLWAMIILVIHHSTLLNGDGDPARHIRHGLWILQHGSLIRYDPFSFTKPGAPFVGFEYGTQLLFGIAHTISELPGVAAVAVILMSLTPALVCWFLLRRGVDPLLAFIGGMVVGFVAQIHFLARPHLVTFVLTIVLLDWLERDRRPPWWAFALLFVVWVNMHGGVLFGLVLVGLYLLAGLIELTRKAERKAAWSQVRSTATILTVGFGALFLTPYGARIPLHLFDFFSDPYIRDHTGEFRSPDFHWAALKPFLAVLMAMIAGLAWVRRPPPVRSLLVIVVTTGFALLAQRNVALFAITAWPLFLVHIDPSWRSLRLGRRFRRGFAAGASLARSGPWVAVGALGLAVVALGGGSVRGIPVLPSKFNERVFPTKLVEEARSANVQGRLFHEFNWGGWLLYAWPEQKVFIDGGTDFYGPGLLREFISIQRMEPGWRASLRAYDIDHALLGLESPLGNELLQDPAWGLWGCDGTGMLLAKGIEHTGLEESELRRCRSPEAGSGASSGP